ncbi:MAG TPA: methyltransferase [Pseudomonas sp.]|nr:methyltransferase [Pseudomonas sp.]
MNSRRLPCLTALLLAVSLPLQAADEPLDRTGQIKDDAYHAVLAGEWRSSENQLRDPQRRPMETLRFFDLSPTQTVIEISPDDGWYSEILAPLLRDQGQYIAAVRSSDDPQQGERADALRAKLKGDPARYDKARIIELDPKSPKLGEAESADLVLSFDDLHNWEEAGSEESMFKAIYAVLKPGGKLGVTAFRAAKGDTLEAVRGSGYLPTAHVVERAKAAGFVLATMEQMHSNPRDDHDHPQGVWSLPPFFAEGEKDRKDYEAVGEPDRMTLLFVKPSAPRP